MEARLSAQASQRARSVDGGVVGATARTKTSVRCFLLLMFCYVPIPRRVGGRGLADASASVGGLHSTAFSWMCPSSSLSTTTREYS